MASSTTVNGTCKVMGMLKIAKAVGCGTGTVHAFLGLRPGGQARPPTGALAAGVCGATLADNRGKFQPTPTINKQAVPFALLGQPRRGPLRRG